MMRWYRELFIGETLQSDAAVIQAEVRRYDPSPEIYLLCLASNETDLLDVIPASALRQAYGKKRNWDIIGLARGKEEAISLTASVMEEIRKETGGFDIRSFVEDKMSED